ncbi:RNA pseudouridine synthase 4, mitochondrial-like isoform X1 [Typha angustifolia]|uniref:RNA pseudouridine synthase 4, mitochondrial-like isoform X1 n=1 Tax=Typha angustifolia TaxID=59011 RepID=UPI003C2E9F25
MSELRFLLRRILSSRRLRSLPIILDRSSYSTIASASHVNNGARGAKEKGKWLELPPFTPPIDASSLGRKISGKTHVEKSVPITALKWVRRCCPNLPMSLVQKLFRLRQVRKNLTTTTVSCTSSHSEQLHSKRVSAQEAVMPGDVILLPVTVQKSNVEKSDKCINEEETNFIHNIELYRDTAIIVVNKPPGMPVQGGVGIKYSMDEIAATSLRYDQSEPPRLVHRLDRDSSGVLVLGRNQISASILHSIFREKTSGVLSDGIIGAPRVLQRKYLALVFGIPKHLKGLISAPLAKIVLEDGKSERIIIADNMKSTSAQHALTEYKVIESFAHGFTWLELCPLTGRKHQLRVHCAEILRMPIVGDYKYGWHAHKKWKALPAPPLIARAEFHKKKLPFGLELDSGSISDTQPRLHLHCKQMVLPNISVALQQFQSSTKDQDFSNLEKLTFVAPLPWHMQTSWNILKSST